MMPAAIFLLLLFLFLNNSTYARSVTSEQLSEQTQAEKTVKLLKNKLTKTSPNFINLYQLAVAYIILEKPEDALNCLQQARQLAQQPFEQRMVLFKLGVVQLWLGNYEMAEKIYRDLLLIVTTPKEHEIALGGLISSLSYQDYPGRANKLAAPTCCQTAELLLATTQAYSWSDQPFLAKKLLNENSNIITTVNPQNYIAKKLTLIDMETYQQTAKHELKPLFYYAHDNEDFNISRYGFNYKYRYNETIQTGFITTATRYTQPEFGGVNGTNLLFAYGEKINPVSNFNITLGRGSYSHTWHPLLGSAQIEFTPNDIYKIKLYSQKDIVETVPAILNKIGLTTYGLNIAYNPFYRLRTQADFFHRDFDDNNHQNGYYLNASYLLSNQWGFSAGVRLRGYKNSNPGNANYFDPKTLKETSLVFSDHFYLKQGHQFYVDLALGQQTINPGGRSIIRYGETGFDFALAKHLRLQTYLGITNSAFNNASGYTMSYGGINVQLFS